MTVVLIVAGALGYFVIAKLLGCHELGSMKDLLSPILRKLKGK
jgi:hypothetical protein